jgi:flagellum-specific peptidoglycan hydrolase FlgJ
MTIKLHAIKSFFIRHMQLLLKVLEKHWLKAIVIGFVAFLALERDLTIQVQLSTKHPAVLWKSEKEQDSSPDRGKVQLTSFQHPQANQEQRSYINRFAKVAQAEMVKFGIPASITLAQGLLESKAGASPLATKNNNHFGIKCFSRNCRKGHCRNFEDDSHKDFFRVYASAWESYRAHSQLLKREDRYQALFDYPVHDYKSWAHGLAKAGYATDPNYAKKLIRLIENLGLHRYDQKVVSS